MAAVLLSSMRLQFAAMVREQLPWVSGAGLVWALLVFVQEPAFAVRFDVPFVEPSMRMGAIVLGLSAGPLAAEFGGSSWWNLRDRSRQPVAAVAGLLVGGSLFSALAAAVHGAAFTLVAGLLGGHMSSFRAAAGLASAWFLAGSLSFALAPAVARLGTTLAARAVIWGLLFTVSSGVLGFSAPIPIPSLWTLSGSTALAAALPTASAWVASFCLAVAAFGRKTPAVH